MSFFSAKNDMIRENSEENAIAFSEAFADLVNRNENVLIPVHEVSGGLSMELNQHYGEMFPVMFSAREKAVVRPDGGKLVETPIQSLIDAVYRNPRLAGIAVDPQDEPVYIKRRQIDGLTCRKDPRLEEKDWGEGVPSHYRQTDLLVIEELTDFAMDIVTQVAERQGYGIFEAHSSPVYIPNLILEKDGEIYFAVVEAAIAPKMPVLAPQKAEALKEYAKKANAKCLYASVGIGSKDQERFAAGLALCGDHFIINFTGFTAVD